MCSEAQFERMLREIVSCYRELFGDAVEGVYLYGSYARGEQDAQSDVDLVAVVHGDRQSLQHKLLGLWDRSAELSLDYDLVISPTVVPYDEFQRYRDSLPYYRSIASEGRKVG